MDINIENAGKAFEALKDAIGLTREVLNWMRTRKAGDKDVDAIAKKLDEAERATKLAEAQIAESLGYQLCKCEFPPTIMLSIEHRDLVEIFKCPRCGKKYPPLNEASGQMVFP